MQKAPQGISSGTRLALVLIIGGIILSILATKFRIFMPPIPATQPVTTRPS